MHSVRSTQLLQVWVDDASLLGAAHYRRSAGGCGDVIGEEIRCVLREEFPGTEDGTFKVDVDCHGCFMG